MSRNVTTADITSRVTDNMRSGVTFGLFMLAICVYRSPTYIFQRKKDMRLNQNKWNNLQLREAQ
jgi:hypothetical protein